MSDTPSGEWRFYVDGMIGFAGTVIDYTHDLDQAAWSEVVSDVPALLPELLTLEAGS